MNKLHTVLAFAYNEPGVLNKLFSLIRKKRYNVETITAGHTHVPNLSRMTIAFSQKDESKIEQIVKQIQNITEVTTTEDVTNQEVIIRELVLLKVKATTINRAHIAATADVMGGRVVNVAPDNMIVEFSDSPAKIENAITVFGDIGLLGVARTGATVIHKETEDMGVDSKGRKKVSF